MRTHCRPNLGVEVDRLRGTREDSNVVTQGRGLSLDLDHRCGALLAAAYVTRNKPRRALRLPDKAAEGTKRVQPGTDTTTRRRFRPTDIMSCRRSRVEERTVAGLGVTVIAVSPAEVAALDRASHQRRRWHVTGQSSSKTPELLRESEALPKPTQLTLQLGDHSEESDVSQDGSMPSSTIEDVYADAIYEVGETLPRRRQSAARKLEA